MDQPDSSALQPPIWSGGAAEDMGYSSRNGRRRWWLTLPDNYYEFGDEEEAYSDHDPFTVRGAAFADRLMRTGLGSLLGLSLAPALLKPGGLSREMELLRFYGELVDRDDVDAVFQPPPARLRVQMGPARRREWSPQGIDPLRLGFESPFVPMHPLLRARWAGQRRNRHVSAQYWAHPRGPRKTLIFVHGFLIHPYWINSVGFCLPWLYRKGYDVLLVKLPFHGERREGRAPLSGLGFVAGGLAHFNEAMLQAVMELRCWLDFLIRRGVPEVGVSGMSLGGYLAALMAAVEPRLSFSIPNSPVVAPVDMVMEWQPLRTAVQALMWRDEVAVRQLRHGMALHSPLTWAPRVDPSRLMIIGGAGDRVTPPRFIDLLHRHWRGSRLHWFAGNHLVHLHQNGYLREMKQFMDACHQRGGELFPGR